MKTLATLLKIADDNIERAREELTLLRLYVDIPHKRVEEFRARMSATVCFDLAIKSAAIKRRKMVQ